MQFEEIMLDTSYDDKLEMLDDFHLLFSNKYKDIIVLIFKVLLLSISPSEEFAADLLKRDTVFDYKSSEFKQFIFLSASLFKKVIYIEFEKGENLCFKPGNLEATKLLDFEGFESICLRIDNELFISSVQGEPFFEFYGCLFLVKNFCERGKDSVQDDSMFMGEDGKINQDKIDLFFSRIIEEVPLKPMDTDTSLDTQNKIDIEKIEDQESTPNFMENDYVTNNSLFDPYDVYLKEAPENEAKNLNGDEEEEKSNDAVVEQSKHLKDVIAIKYYCRVCNYEYPYSSMYYFDHSFFCGMCFGKMGKRFKSKQVATCAICQTFDAPFIHIKYYIIDAYIKNPGTLSFTKPKQIDKTYLLLSKLSARYKSDLRFLKILKLLQDNLAVPLSTHAKLRVCDRCKNAISRCCKCSSKISDKEAFKSQNCAHKYCIDCLSHVFLKKYGTKKFFTCKSGILCRKKTDLEIAKGFLEKKLELLENSITQNMAGRLTVRAKSGFNSNEGGLRSLLEKYKKF